MIMVSEDLANLVNETSRSGTKELVCAGVFFAHERPPGRQTGYNRRGQDYAAFHAEDCELIARTNLYYPAYRNRLLMS